MGLSELKNDINNRLLEDVEAILFVYGLTLFRAEDFRMYGHLKGMFECDHVFNLCRVAVLGSFVSSNLWYGRWMGLVHQAISQCEEIEDAYGRLCSFMKKNYGRDLRQDVMRESCNIDVGAMAGVVNWLLFELLGEHSSENIAELRARIEKRLMALTQDELISECLIDFDKAKAMSTAQFWPNSYKDYMMREAEKKLFGNRKLT